jgi:hypothetical protein
MADTKFSALTAVTTPASTDEWGVNQGGNSKKMTLDQVRAYMLKVLSGATGTANQNGAGTRTVQTLTSNASSNSTTTIAIVMTTSSLTAGTYRFRYDIIAQSGATTTAHKFSVAFSGTVTKGVWHLFFPSAGVTAATGSVTQNANVTTGSVWAHESSRTISSSNTTLGPGTDVDAANSDVHYVIEGILVCSVGGDLTLGHASEVAASSQVMSGTMLELVQTA